MKTIYLCQDENNVKRVYSTQEKVYQKSDITKNLNEFTDTEYIFSTWGMPQFSKEEIRKYLPSLKAIFYAAGTVQGFARPFLNCGVKVFSAWAANAVPVAEYTVAQIILANKGFYRTSIMSDMNDYYKNREISSRYIGNYGAKIGIVGAGMIGKLVIEMLKAYKLEVLVFDPFLPDEKAHELGVEKCSLEIIFSECNVVSNHLADNVNTRGILNFGLFDKMLPNSTFLNTGRGGQVVEGDLISILKQRPDITAILDVTEPEPPQSKSEFYKLKNCILTPHIAGSIGSEVHRMAEYMLDEYNLFIGGKPTRYEVTEEMLETMA